MLLLKVTLQVTLGVPKLPTKVLNVLKKVKNVLSVLETPKKVWDVLDVPETLHQTIYVLYSRESHGADKRGRHGLVSSRGTWHMACAAA